VAEGTFTGLLVVSNNLDQQAQSVNLSGTAPATPFVITPPAGGASSTVNAGQPASFTLSVTPAGGYSGSLSMTCTNLPAHAACAFAPATISLAGGNSVSVTLTIATKAAQSASLMRDGVVGYFFLAFVLVWPICRKRRTVPAAMLLLVVALGLSSCGGGSPTSGTPVTPQPSTVAPGTYTVQVVASDGTKQQTQALTLIVK
jgi:hypothetical protein